MKKLACLILGLALTASAFSLPLTILHRGRSGTAAAPGGFAQVQSNTYSSTADSTTHAVTFGSTPTSGNRLIIAICSGGVIASAPSGWTKETAPAANSRGVYLFTKIAGASEPTSVTFTQNAAAALVGVSIEYSGMVTSSGLDQIAVNTPSGTPSSVTVGPTSTTTTATDLVIAVFGGPGDQSADNDGLCSFSSATGYTTVGAVHSTNTSAFGTCCIGVVSKSVTTTGAQSATGTFTTTTGQPGAIIAAYKQS